MLYVFDLRANAKMRMYLHQMEYSVLCIPKTVKTTCLGFRSVQPIGLASPFQSTRRIGTASNHHAQDIPDVSGNSILDNCHTKHDTDCRTGNNVASCPCAGPSLRLSWSRSCLLERFASTSNGRLRNSKFELRSRQGSLLFHCVLHAIHDQVIDRPMIYLSQAVDALHIQVLNHASSQ